MKKRNGKRLGRLAALLCILGMSLFLSACRGKDTSEGKEEEKEDYPTLVVVNSGSYGNTESFARVEEKINAITREKLGVEVEFKVIGGDYNNQVELMLTSGEQVDILCASNTMFMKMYINRQLCDLEDLLEDYGQDIIEQVGMEYINCCRIGGVLYGLPNNRDYAAGWDSYALRKDILDKYQIQAEDIKSIQDLENLFDLILEKEPGMTPLACSGSLFGNFALADGINSFPAGGHTDYGQDEEVVNIFETDEYLDQLRRVRRWYLKGYLGQNILENTDGTTEMMRNGTAFAVAIKNKPGVQTQESLKCGRELEIVQLGETAISYNSMAAFPWMITKNTVSEELSMKLLNLFYKDADIMNLLSYGIEGEDYVKTEDGRIALSEGKNSNPYYGNAWRLPNQFITYVWESDPPDLWERMRRWNQTALRSCEIGFNFNVFPVSGQYLKVEEIYNTYKPILESGMVNPEQGLAQMLSEMEEAGLDEVIAEKKRQFQSWQKANKAVNLLSCSLKIASE